MDMVNISVQMATTTKVIGSTIKFMEKALSSGEMEDNTQVIGRII